jgi:hypothetical protein
MKSIILEGLGWNSFVKSSQAYENISVTDGSDTVTAERSYHAHF